MRRVLDAGITRALARFIALYDTRDDPRAIRECVGLGLCAFTLIGVRDVAGRVVRRPARWPTRSGHVSGDQMSQILVAMAVIFIVQGYSAVLQALARGCG